MKKIFSIAALAASAAFGAANDVLVTFSTPGPDKYADGKTVMDGERYALVYVADEANFKITADGKAEGGEIVLSAPVAKNGRCPVVMFEVDAALAAKKYSGGKWAVYLLDTRTFSKNAAGEIVAKLSGGGTVNTVGLVGTADIGSSTVGDVSGVAAATGEIAKGANAPEPEVSDIFVDGDKVYIYVKGTVPYLSYGLKTGATPGGVAEEVGAKKSGQIGAEEEIYFVAPAGEKGFFRIGS